jgi:uncharacterized SAM-binding protein YcdF (DUF218 family)
MARNKKYFLIVVCSCILFTAIIYNFSSKFLFNIGDFLEVDEYPTKADAIVVLNTGVEYYPRLVEAALLYRNGLADKIVINGNRKSDELRELEMKGFKPCCSWDEDRKRILELLQVPRKDVISISAEDVYDTISEAETVGSKLIEEGHKKIIIATSRFHTKRARHIWKHLYSDKLMITVVSAKTDPYDPKRWWKKGRQIKWVLAEYGAWVYYYWKKR